MNISIVTIGNTNHAAWTVKEDTFKAGTKEVKNYFLQSADSKVLQKIKFGGEYNTYPEDANFNIREYNSTDIIKYGKDDEVSIQTLKVPFKRVFINPKNMNPYLAGYGTFESNDRLVVLLLGTNYKYIRSSINHELAEVICTFHTQTAIGCVIRVSENKIPTGKDSDMETPIIMIDTIVEKNFFHFIVNHEKSEDEFGNDVSVVRSKIKNKNIITKLTQLNDQIKSKKIGRRFVRFNSALITSCYVVSNSMDENKVIDFLNEKEVSEVIEDTVSFIMYKVNVDEKGYIIKDDFFKEVVLEMKKRKVKAFTLVGCKLQKNTFVDVKPLYIFSIDETDSLNPPKSIKCVKSN